MLLRVVIVGSGQTAERLAELVGQLGYGEIRVTDRIPRDLSTADHLVVAEDDPRRGEEQLLVAARLPDMPAYLGLAAPRSDGLRAMVRLAAENVPAPRLEQIAAPAGVDVGAETAAEVAISVAAELVAVRRGRRCPPAAAPEAEAAN
jgi:xanthine dehydrogenase accessory factor